MSIKYQVRKHRVFEILEENEMSKGQLAKALGVTPQAVIKRWKNGWRVDSAELLAKLLNVELKEILK